MKIVSIILISTLAGFLYSVTWTITFDLLNMPDNMAVVFGVLLAGLLIGISAYGIVRLVKTTKILFKE